MAKKWNNMSATDALYSIMTESAAEKAGNNPFLQKLFGIGYKSPLRNFKDIGVKNSIRANVRDGIVEALKYGMGQTVLQGEIGNYVDTALDAADVAYRIKELPRYIKSAAALNRPLLGYEIGASPLGLLVAATDLGVGMHKLARKSDENYYTKGRRAAELNQLYEKATDDDTKRHIASQIQQVYEPDVMDKILLKVAPYLDPIAKTAENIPLVNRGLAVLADYGF